MKKFFKSLGAGLGFVGIFVGAQLIVFFALNFYYSAMIGYESAQSGNELALKEINALLSDKFTGAITLISVISGVVALLIILIIFKARHKNFREEINIKPIRLISIPIIILMGISLNLLIQILISCLPIPLELMESYSQASQFTQDTSIISFLAIVIMAPIAEEIFFRGLVLSRFSKSMPIVVSIILQAIIFGLIHGTVLWFSYATIIGLVLGLLAYKQKSILGCMILHFSINGLSFMINIFKIEFNDVTAMVTLIISAIVFVICIVMMFSNKFNNSKQKIVNT